MKNEQLANYIMNMFLGIKKEQIHDMMKIEGHTHNEKIVLCLLHSIIMETKNETVSLAILRKKINLAPSTITPILNSLEDKNIIQRVIDKSDRRNIFIKFTEKGNEFTQNEYNKLKNIVYEYIEYMGEENIKKMIYLTEKTNEFIKERKNENEENI